MKRFALTLLSTTSNLDLPFAIIEHELGSTQTRIIARFKHNAHAILVANALNTHHQIRKASNET